MWKIIVCPNTFKKMKNRSILEQDMHTRIKSWHRISIFKKDRIFLLLHLTKQSKPAKKKEDVNVRNDMFVDANERLGEQSEI